MTTGLLQSSSVKWTNVSAFGPSPFMHNHLGAASNRPWAMRSPPQNAQKQHSNDASSLPDGKENEALTQSPLSTASTVHNSQSVGVSPMEHVSPKAVLSPSPTKAEDNRSKVEPEWWDFWPNMCQAFCTDTSRVPHGKRKALCGVGIVFEEDNQGALVVQKLIHGGPAYETGMIEPQDALVNIDGRNVYRMPPEHIGPLVLGPANQEVTMTFLRKARSGSYKKVDETFHVSMLRKHVPSS